MESESNVCIRQVNAREARPVLRMALAELGKSRAEIEGHVTLFLHYARDMELPPALHWCAERNGAMVSACSCLESPGRTAMLFLPDGRIEPASAPIIAELATAVAESMAGRGVVLLQCLLAPEDTVNAAALRRACFHELAELLYLEWNTPLDPSSLRAPVSPSGDGLEWATYAVNTECEFREVIASSYEGSLDCPSLSELRTLDDTMLSHQSSGRFDPTRWLLLRANGRAVACNLLCENPLRPVLEIAYMGVRSDARGHGFGRTILRAGLALAHHAGFTRVTLAVDARNAPARHLYGSEGFHETMRRRAFVRAIDPTARAT
ncbi:MAG: GNAT family N-acetyltransferase [Planctomycetes bacterium]|nr:GNAT family N-acetyltransferase [Planctomycetota bacterium]